MTDQYMPFFVGDYLRDTMHLTNAQHGQYLLLLCCQWSRGPFSGVTARAVCGRNITFVLHEYFTKDKHGNWYSEKLEKIRQHNDSIRKKRKAAATKRWMGVDASAYAHAHASASRLHNQLEPEPDIKEKSKQKKKSKGTRFKLEKLPDDWRAACKKLNKHLDPDDTFDRFHDYWIGVAGAKGVKLDWLATWRNWCRNQNARAKLVLPADDNKLMQFAADNDLSPPGQLSNCFEYRRILEKEIR